jgi:hypothetical protein
MVDTKTGSGIVALPEHMTMNVLADDNQFGALMMAMRIHKEKGQHQWHSVAEIEATPPPSNSEKVREAFERWKKSRYQDGRQRSSGDANTRVAFEAGWRSAVETKP